MIITNIYKGIVSISISSGIISGLYIGHTIAKDNFYNKNNMSVIENIGEGYCYSIILLSGGFLGLIGGTLFGITSPIMVPYTIYNISIISDKSNTSKNTER